MSQQVYVSLPARDRPKPGVVTPPVFREFGQTWYEEMMIEWRINTQRAQRSILDCWLLPYFDTTPITWINRDEVLKYRTWLGKQTSSQGRPLSKGRINAILSTLGAILREYAQRHGSQDPMKGIRRLKPQPRPVQPFSLNEAWLLIEHAPEKYRNYLTVRIFTGMRSAEIHGLKWSQVDFSRSVICVRETFVNGRMEYTKNQYSQRDIAMHEPVYEALRNQQARQQGCSDFVFASRAGTPIHESNFRTMIWKPLLKELGMPYRPPHQCRHTAASLMLAAGEPVWWITRQLGHASPSMLLDVYSRYLPNQGRRMDGEAINELLKQTENIHE